MEYREIMEQSINVFRDRGGQYGDVIETLNRQAKIATLILNKPITAYDIAMIQHACKLGRLEGDRAKLDTYVDGVNYLVFGGMLATTSQIEDEIAELARKFAPAAQGEA